MPGSDHDDVKSIGVVLPRHEPLIRGQAAAKKTLHQAGPIECVLRHSSGPEFIDLIETSSRPNRGTGTVPRKPRPQLVGKSPKNAEFK